jgi:nitroreductase
MNNYQTKTKSSNSSDRSNILDNLLAPAKLFAESYGLQPFKIITIDEPILKRKFLDALDRSIQADDNSHLIVFAVRSAITKKHISQFIAQIIASKGNTHVSLDHDQKQIERFTQNERGGHWAIKQAVHASQILATTAKQAGTESVPVQIKNPKQLDELLHLESEGLTARIAVILRLPAVQKSWIHHLQLNN